MMIMLSRSQYRLENRGGIFFVNANVALHCPICGGTLVFLSRRSRFVISYTGDKERLKIRRMRCSECGKIHHELPDYLVPYKWHCAETIESVITGNSENVPCETNVIRKIKSWWSAMSAYFTNIMIAFAARLGMAPPESPTFIEIIRAVVNSHSWTFPGKLTGV